MEYKIKKGDKFLCLKDYVMNDGSRVDYTDGKIYQSDLDGAITDNDECEKHWMDGQDDFFDYFKPINN